MTRLPDRKYALLRSDGSPISQYAGTNTSDRYRKRGARDPCCWITGRAVLVVDDFSRFKATHIYPRTHDTEWTDRHAT
ncbi:hypothetical protein K438DRAFT_1981306 [Mycena galopus ATCC 62051]|nr:hypothetical protein K438DRAFT_1981306 [Mycena galopus ATCC 62051]